jgi:hypothetical protein
MKTGPIIRPLWMRTIKHKPGYGLQVARPAINCNIYDLSLAFSRKNPIYGEAYKTGRLVVEIMADGGLAVVNVAVDGKKVLDTVAVNQKGEILRDGAPLMIDGKVVGLHAGECRLPVEKVFTKLGEVPVSQDRKTYLPPPDIWAWPPDLPLRPPLSLENSAAGSVLRLAVESRFQAEQLAVHHRGEKLVIMSGKECLGVVADGQEGGRRQSVDLGREVPVLNYGPYYGSVIDKSLGENDEQKLADLFLYDLGGFRRSLKPLEYFARDYFAHGALLLPKSIKLVNLWLEGISLIEKDSWLLPDEKKWLLGCPCPVSASRMPVDDILRVLTGTVELSMKLGDFSDRQFLVVEGLYREIAGKKMETLTWATLGFIRQQYYSHRTR